MILTVYSKEMTKKELFNLATGLYDGLGFMSYYPSEALQIKVFLSESVKFIVHHFGVTDQLVPIVISFLKRDKEKVYRCLCSFPNAYHRSCDFERGNTYQFDRILSTVLYSTYLCPDLPQSLETILGKVIMLYQPQVKESSSPVVPDTTGQTEMLAESRRDQKE